MNKERKTIDECWDHWSKYFTNEDGSINIDNLKKELSDLDFCHDQIAHVYCTITGSKLSYTTYYADTIIGVYEEEIQEAYNRGYEDCKEDSKSPPPQDLQQCARCGKVGDTGVTKYCFECDLILAKAPQDVQEETTYRCEQCGYKGPIDPSKYGCPNDGTGIHSNPPSPTALEELEKDIQRRIDYHEKRFGDDISHNILIELKSVLGIIKELSKP